MGIFIDLTDLEVQEEIRANTSEEFFIERDGHGYVAYLEDGWLPNNYANESEAYRAILAELVGFSRTCYYD